MVEIRRITKPTQWNHCPTVSNPADICSRGSMTSKLITNELWWSGPKFLRKEKEWWPSLAVNSVAVTSDNLNPCLELKKGSCNNRKKQHESTVLANIASGEVTSKSTLNLDCIIPLERFSSLQRLMRVTAYVLRFVSNLKRSKMKEKLVDGEIRYEVGQTEETLTRRARFLQRTLDHFWNRWRSEYLTQLREYHRYSKRENSVRKVQVGDIVCVHENKPSRQQWRLGKIERLRRGRDGHVRSAVVRVKSGNSPTAEWRRPLQRLYPLEVKLDTETDNPALQVENVPITVVRDENVPVVVVNYV